MPCTHEPCLYFCNNYNNTNKKVLLLRQVDDFAVACEDAATAKHVIAQINDRMTISVKELGEISRFNGIDIQQTRYYVKISNKTYINKMLQKHSWIHNEKPITVKIPMKSDSSYQRQLEQHIDTTPEEIIALENEMGFGYRQAVGELIYALTTCRPDISYPIIKLSQYSTRPGRIHFEALKTVYRYLHQTKDEGIHYWRQTPRDDLPDAPLPTCTHTDNYNSQSIPERYNHPIDQLYGAVDSS